MLRVANFGAGANLQCACLGFEKRRTCGWKGEEREKEWWYIDICIVFWAVEKPTSFKSLM